jgi:multiple sugar transport system substrate-binding protein
MNKKYALLVLSVLLVLSLLLTACGPKPGAEGADDRTKVVIFVGLGTGTDPHQISMQEELAAEFNASHDDIEIEFMIVPYEEAGQRLLAMIAGDTAPQLVGPMGVGSVAEGLEMWEDISPYIAADNFDMSDFYSLSVDLNTYPDKVVGLPLGLYPSFLFYNIDAFDAQGLDYPPADFNDTSWTFDRLRQDALLLTLDANGNNAASPDFDPENIVQWGYDDSWIDLRGWLAPWGAERVGSPTSADYKTAVVNSPEWVMGLEWIMNGIWVDHFIPDTAGQQAIEATGADPFSSGMVAMWNSHTWYMSEGLYDLSFEIQIAPTPFNPEGTRIARAHADIFAIPSGAKNKDAAWEVMKWLTSEENIVRVCEIYGCIPARQSVQASYVESLNTRYPGLDTNVIFESLNYIDIPNIESWTPEPARVMDVINNTQSLVMIEQPLTAQELLDQANVELQKILDEYWAEQE